MMKQMNAHNPVFNSNLPEVLAMPMRRAKVFAAVCREMPIEIWPDELIVGHAGARPLCRDVIPDDIAVLLKGHKLNSLMVDTVEYELKDFDLDDQKELGESDQKYTPSPRPSP